MHLERELDIGQGRFRGASGLSHNGGVNSVGDEPEPVEVRLPSWAPLVLAMVGLAGLVTMILLVR